MITEHISMWQIWDRSNGKCHICGIRCDKNERGHKNLLGVTVDHVVALAAGGKHQLSNLLIAHRVCNSIKIDLPLTGELIEKCRSRVERLLSQRMPVAA